LEGHDVWFHRLVKVLASGWLDLLFKILCLAFDALTSVFILSLGLGFLSLSYWKTASIVDDLINRKDSLPIVLSQIVFLLLSTFN
jgi:hypothetical protein